MGGGGKGDSQTVGYKYFAGVHAVLCHGVLDKITRLTHDKRIAWSGAAVGGETITVDAPELFGGESREGGVAGDIDILDGKPTQGLNAYLVSKLGSSIPAFRGVVSLIFKGYYWGNNPYLKGFAARAQRIHKKSDGSAQWHDSMAEVLSVDTTFPKDKYYEVSIHDQTQVWIAAHDGQYIYAVTGIPASNSYSVYRARVGDLTSWELCFNNYYVDVMGRGVRPLSIYSDSYVVVVGFPYGTVDAPNNVARLAVSFDRGVTWQKVLVPTSSTTALANRIAKVGDAYLVVGGVFGGFILRSIDALNFVQVHSTPNTEFNSSVASVGNVVVATGISSSPSTGLVAVSLDGGITWTDTYLPYGTGTVSLIAVGNGREIIVYQPSTFVLHKTTDGESWNTINIFGYLTGIATWIEPFFGQYLIYHSTGTIGTYLTSDFMSESLAWLGSVDPSIALNQGGDVTKNGLLLVRSSSNTKLTIWHIALPTGDMNPAHIIRECLTDPLWGMGYPEADVDYISFIQAADTLFSEQMGISLLWETSMKIESFILEILRHIDGTLYIEPTTGLYTLKLIRDDYDENSLLVLDEDNIDKIEAFSRPLPGELINSVTVTYWDKATGENASVTVQDPALVQQQGAVIATTVDYPGFTNQDIAVRVANRDLISLSSELASCTIYTGIDAKGLRPGDAFKLNYPEYEANDLVMRVTEISYGDGRSNMIRIKAVEDVFSTPSFAVVADQESEWVDPATIQPEPLDTRVIGESPYYELVRVMGQRTADDEINYNPDIGYLLASAPRPSGSELNALVYVDVGTGYKKTSVFDFCPACSLVNPVGRLDTVWEISGGVDISDAMSGRIAQIGTELIQIESISGTLDEIVVKRGVLDSVVQEHSAGSAVVVWDGYLATDTTQYLNNETIDVKVKTTTGSNVLPLGSAPVDQVTFAGRAYRPYPPGNLKINDEYEPADIVEGDIEVTWSHRDRLQQTSGDLIDFFDADVGPEDGTTYTVELYDNVAHTLLYSEDSIVGNSVIILQDSFESPPDLRVDETNEQRVTEDNEDRLTEIPQYEIRLEIYAVRAGVRSLYKQKVAFNWMYLEES